MRTRFMAAAALSLALTATAHAALTTNTWLPGTNTWESALSWNAGSPSSANAINIISTTGVNVATIDFATTTNLGGVTMTISNLVLGPVGISNILSMVNAGTNTPLQVINSITINPTGVLRITNSVLRLGTGNADNSFVSGLAQLDLGGSLFSDAPILTVAGAGSTTGTLFVTGGSLIHTNNAGLLIIGSTTNGQASVSNGLLFAKSLLVGQGFAPGGTLTIAGGSVMAISNLWLNNGYLRMTGGQLVLTNVSDTLDVGVSGPGTLFMTNGTILTRQLQFDTAGSSGSGMALLGGTITVSSTMTVGVAPSSNTVAFVQGGSLYVTNASHTAQTEVRYGSLTITAGVFVTDSLIVTNSHGSFINNGGTFSITGQAQVDQGTQTVSSGTTTLSSNLWVGSSVGSTGTVNVTGGIFTVTNGVFAVGNDGSLFSTGGVGHVAVSSGLVEAASILIGDSFGGDSGLSVLGNGHVRVRGGLRSNGIKTTLINGGTLEVVDGPPPPFEDPVLHDRITVAYLGDGRMIVSNGTVSGLEMVIGLSNGGGTLEVAGGTVNLSSNLLVGMNSTATGMVTITGGSLVVTSGVFAIGNNGTIGGLGGLGHVAVSNGTVQAASILVGDSNGGDSGLTVAGNGCVMARGGLRSNGIKTTLVNGGTLEVVAGPPPPFEDPILHARIVVSYLADGKLVVSNGTVRTPGMLVGASAGNTGTLLLAGGSTSVFSNLTVGFVACTSTGTVNMTGGSLYVTNGGTAVLEVQSGTFTLSSGTVVVDKLVITNVCAHFNRTGGTLQATTVVLNPALDADGDGLPNGWEQAHGLDPLSSAGVNGAGGDLDGDGLTNLQEYQLGTDPADPNSPCHITGIMSESNNVRVIWLTAGGLTNRLQVSTGGLGGSYSNNFADLSPQIIIPGTGLVSTNYLDASASTYANSDVAADPVYAGGGNFNGLNGGTGFGPWIVTPSSNLGTMGWYVGSSTNNSSPSSGGIDSPGGRAWGSYANNGSVAEAVRVFSTGAMKVGQTFALDMDNGWIESGGTVGFGLQNASGQNLIEVFYIGFDSVDSYKSNDGSGQHNLGVPWTADGLHVQITPTSSTNYSGTIKAAGGTNVLFSGSLMNPSGGQGIVQVRLFNANAAGLNSGAPWDVFWNNLSLSSPTNFPARFYRLRLVP